jgi:hypothetical protein
MWTASGGKTAGNISEGFTFANGNQSGGTLGIYNASTGTQSFYVDERYFQASRPWDLGDGEIPLFIQLIINNATSEIEGHVVAPDPVWGYNGPTNITPDIYVKENGVFVGYQKQLILPPGIENMPNGIAKKRAIAGFAKAADNSNYANVKVDQSIKNSDMNIIPHPWVGNDLTGKTVVMLDPVSSVVEDLLYMHEDGEQVIDIIRDYINLGNSELGRKKPDAVMSVAASWKNNP